MQIKSGILLKILVPVVVLVVTMIGVKSCGSQKSAQPQSGNTGAAALTREELSLLGIEGDTPQDTLRTLLGRIKTIQKNQDTLEIQSRALTAENDRLRAQGENVEARISEAVAAVSQENTLAQQQLADEQQRLTDLLESLLSTPPVSRNSADSVLPAEPPETVWTEPQDSQPTISGSAAGSPALFPAAFGSAEDNAITRQKAELDRTAKQQTADVPGTPVYTVPENATLTGSRAMTALLGRIPADGKVTDPYPFKILIGRENLTANGIELPDLAGAVVSGTATGDWVLSCVRGEVHSMTFVFTDGTVRTVPQAGKQGKGRSHRGSGIGWLSDESGVPCISGERKTNAATYLPTLFALSAAGAAADVMATGQGGSAADSASVTGALAGSAGQVALGKAVSGGTNELAEWVKARYGQMFDAVYVPPGVPVAVHITRQITVDYEPDGRRVKYTTDSRPRPEMD